MKVADLQDILSLIRQMLISAGSKGPAAELADFSSTLDPFRGLTPKQFANELRKLTEAPPKPKPAKKGGKPSAAEVDAMIADVKSLYDRAGAPTTTAEHIQTTTKCLDGLLKKDLVRTADAIGLPGMKNKKVPEIIAAIRQRIEARMGAAQRMAMIEVVAGSERQ